MSQVSQDGLAEPVRVLVVEDDGMILEDVAATLVEAGFGVDIASNAAEAIAMIDPAVTTALLTDIDLGAKLPTGWDVARAARERIPDIPVVYMTGGNADEWTAHGVPNSILVRKPFVPAQVITALAQLLNTANST